MNIFFILTLKFVSSLTGFFERPDNLSSRKFEILINLLSKEIFSLQRKDM